MIDESLELDQEVLIKISKTLFYGFSFLAGVSLMVSINFAGTMFGLAVLSSITLISAGLADAVGEDWARFLDVVAVSSLMVVLLFASFTAARLSML